METLPIEDMMKAAPCQKIQKAHRLAKQLELHSLDDLNVAPYAPVALAQIRHEHMNYISLLTELDDTACGDFLRSGSGHREFCLQLMSLTEPWESCPVNKGASRIIKNAANTLAREVYDAKRREV